MSEPGLPSAPSNELPGLGTLAFDMSIPDGKKTVTGGLFLFSTSFTGLLFPEAALISSLGAFAASSLLLGSMFAFSAFKKYRWLLNEADPQEVLERQTAAYFEANPHRLPTSAWFSSSDMIRGIAHNYASRRTVHCSPERYRENIEHLIRAGSSGHLERILSIASSPTRTAGALHTLEQRGKRIEGYEARNRAFRGFAPKKSRGVTEKTSERFQSSVSALESALGAAPHGFVFNGSSDVSGFVRSLEYKLELLKTSERLEERSGLNPTSRKLVKEIEKGCRELDELRMELLETFRKAATMPDLKDALGEIQGLSQAYSDLAPLRGLPPGAQRT